MRFEAPKQAFRFHPPKVQPAVDLDSDIGTILVLDDVDLVEMQFFAPDCLVESLFDSPSGGNELHFFLWMLDAHVGAEFLGMQKFAEESFGVFLHNDILHPCIFNQIDSNA